jgi:SAM-dependent methyltransferase
MASSKSSRPYQWLAQFNDQLVTLHRPVFAQARQQILSPILGGVESVCDLACGTGTTAISFAKAGFKTYGVDLSPEMIRQAQAKSAKLKKAIHFSQGDMRAFKLPEAVDLITCEFDAINHVPRKSDLQRVAKAVAKALKPGGYFYFDVNNRPAFENIWPLAWFQETKSFAVMVHGGHIEGEDRAWADVEWLIKEEGDLWRREHEHVEEVCWSKKEISETLAIAGFKIAGTFDASLFFQNDPLVQPGYRTFYLARYNRTI